MADAVRGPLLMLAALALIAGPSAVARSRAVTPSSDSGVDVRILRPVPLDTPPPTVTLTYRADPRGQFMIMAETNGAPVRFLVDTGATLVALTTRAAGIDLRNFIFDQVVRTSNGSIPAASVLLREIRVGKLSVHHIRATVIEKVDRSSDRGGLPQSVEELSTAAKDAEVSLVGVGRTAGGCLSRSLTFDDAAHRHRQ